MRTIEATKKCFVSYLFGYVFVFVEQEDGNRKFYTFPGPYGADGWCCWDLEKLKSYPEWFRETVGMLWLRYKKLPSDWNQDDLRLLFSELSRIDIVYLIQDLANDVDPAALCSFANEYPEAFSCFNADWVRQFNPNYQPTKP